MPVSPGDDSGSDPPDTPQQHASAPSSAAWRPRRAGFDVGIAAPAVHWDSDVEANHTPGGSRRHRDAQSLVRRLWDSLPASPGGAELGLIEKASAMHGSLRKFFEGWELVAAFAAALMLVNGIALTHASGPGITFFQGAGTL